jgi:hypothetical protein
MAGQRQSTTRETRFGSQKNVAPHHACVAHDTRLAILPRFAYRRALAVAGSSLEACRCMHVETFSALEIDT